MFGYLVPARAAQTVAFTFTRRGMSRTDALATVRGLIHTFRATGDRESLAYARIIVDAIGA
jgi:hypothetical protein